MQLDFAHAIFERRLTDGFIDVEYKDTPPFVGKNSPVVNMVEPLHDQSPTRIIEAVENLAKTIIYTAGRVRVKVVCTPLRISNTDIRVSVLEMKEI